MLHALVDYEIEVDDPTREVPNPAGLPDYRATGTGMMAKPSCPSRCSRTKSVSRSPRREGSEDVRGPNSQFPV